jgi:hypothetical protein
MAYVSSILENQSESLYHLQRIMSDEGCTYSLAESSAAASAGGRVVGAVACSMQLRVPVAANV